MARRKSESSGPMLANFALTTMKVMLVIGFLCMLMIAVDQSKKKYETDGVKPPVIAMVTISWPNDMDVDIDLHAKCPNGESMNYVNRTACLASLERDARGSSTDTAIINGSKVLVIDNREVINFRRVLEGEWIINVQWYSSRAQRTPVPVQIEVAQVNPDSRILFRNTVIMDEVKQEKHALRFEMASDGTIKEISTDRPISIIPGARFSYD